MKPMSDVLENMSIDPDIEKMLDDAVLNCGLDAARATAEYCLGRIEERIQIAHEGLEETVKKIAPSAEMYLYALRKLIPGGGILQYRIGKDYTTNAPVIFTVVSTDNEDLIPHVRKLARTFELYLYHSCDIDCSFWIISDGGIAQPLIEQDFPFYRENIYAHP